MLKHCIGEIILCSKVPFVNYPLMALTLPNRVKANTAVRFQFPFYGAAPFSSSNVSLLSWLNKWAPHWPECSRLPCRHTKNEPWIWSLESLLLISTFKHSTVDRGATLGDKCHCFPASRHFRFQSGSPVTMHWCGLGFQSYLPWLKQTNDRVWLIWYEILCCTYMNMARIQGFPKTQNETNSVPGNN